MEIKNKKTITIGTLVVFFVIFGVYQAFFKKTEAEFTLVEVVKNSIVQEVSETGTVKKGEAVNLSFKNSGKIERIYVAVGEEIKRGDILAKLETNQLKIQLQEAKATLSLNQAKLDKLLAGASQEDIKIAQTNIENSQISLDSANQNLKDSQEDALNVLDDAYLKSYNAQNVVDSIQMIYFTSNDQTSLKVKESVNKIKNAVSVIEEKNGNSSNLNQVKDEVSKISVALGVIRDACEEPTFRNLVSSTDKTSLDTQRSNINTAVTNLANYQQAIVAAQLSVELAQGQLQAKQDELAKLTASPRKEDVSLYQAQVEQAQFQIQILESQIEDAVLRSPTKGTITEVNKKAGEIVQPLTADNLIVLLPDSPYQIKVDIYEEDIVKIKTGNPVEISLVAFPDKTFFGEIISINPAEKLKEGVVYYKATVDFKGELSEELKPGMTADLIIQTASKENVFIIPEEALQKKNGEIFVEILENGKIRERKIETGLQGKEGRMEVISGLKEGEKVIVR